ncbi:filamentous hemagglutinin family outer membrane protein [Magnetococcus marinus MC-1]|uniref:Filamentous hemagglutinin family outer membrane protein n=1 Tax=Magnetococcus marinus (strain ATCC BAA-1437 / JCM 17883 / MC-1) TaxID=156889 RepID=A0L5Q8_MAGMM|nr:filamentous hemagglutinin N-terminal domain-containing protein [Magnetococcus marinus]ABK43301.1 filamentous hemagglutinin family outer membrane protein [Magnetococcus marinus MC-1]
MNKSQAKAACVSAPLASIPAKKLSFLWRGVPVCLIMLSFPGQALAGPSGEQVIAGQVTIDRNLNDTIINQATDKAIINWKNFDINPNELVKFIQPDVGSIALNRVESNLPTNILGQLQANGRLFILNANGVIFGRSAQVDVAGLLATTLSIKDNNFLSGKYAFEKVPGLKDAAVENKGEIHIGEGGFAFLVAPGVRNEGLIIAKLGSVALASGDKMTIDFHGDGLVSYEVTGAVAEKVLGADGQPLEALVSNTGTIQADGGNVVMQGHSAGDVFSSVVNNEGIIQAQSLQKKNGKIYLGGDDEGGIVSNSGILDVSAAEPNSAGGEVVMTGHFVGNEGVIEAKGSGSGDGGQVTLISAQHTLTTVNSVIDVSGGADSGSGGVVQIRSANRATFDGVVKADAGQNGGDGGLVDVSSEGEVQLIGKVVGLAPRGRNAKLVIDPKHIEINDAGGGAYNSTTVQFDDSQSGTTVITAASINAQVADVVLQANTDITVTTAINIANAGTGLTLQAGRSILINADLTTNNGVVTLTANDHTALSADRDAGVASIAMASGTTINAGSAAVNMTIDASGHGLMGDITAYNVTSSGAVALDSAGSIIVNGPNFASGSTSIGLTADNDVTVGSALTTGSLTIAAGRSVALNSNVTTTSTVNIKANDSTQTLANRGSGDGAISMAAGTTLNGGSAAITLTVDSTNASTAGGITIDLVTTDGNLTVSSHDAITEIDADSEVDLRGDILSLTTTDTNGAYIGAPGTSTTDYLEVHAKTRVDVTTNNGSVALASPGYLSGTVDWFGAAPTDDIGTTDIDESKIVNLNLGTVNVGTATFMLVVTDGGILDGLAGTGTNITAGSANLTTNGGESVVAGAIVLGNDGTRGGSIGDATHALKTELGILTASSSNGSVYIDEASGILINSINANQKGVTAKVNSSYAVVVTTLDGQTETGTNNVTVTAAGDIIIGTASATSTVTLTSTAGNIYDNNDATNNILAKNVVLNAGLNMGLSGDVLELTTESATLTATNGGVYFAMGVPSTVASVTAGGGHDVVINASDGVLSLGMVSAVGGSVTIDGGTGSILDNNGATANIIANSASIKSDKGAGTASDALETTVDTLAVEITGSGKSFYIDESDALTSINAKVNNGSTNLNFTGGSFAFNATTGAFSSTGVGSVTFENTGGGVAIGTVTATGGSATITASTAITDATSAITADTVVLTAGTSIGASGSTIKSTATTLTYLASAGSIYAQESDGATVNAKAVGTGKNIEFATTTGNLTIGTISAKGSVTLTATAGSVLSGGTSSSATGATVVLSAGTAIGASGASVNTVAANLSATASAGGVYLSNAGDVTLTTAVATGAGFQLSNTGALVLNGVTAAGQAVSLTASGAITDGNGATNNISAESLTLVGLSIGSTATNGAVDTQVNSVTATTTSGGIYLNELGSGGLTITAATAVGSDANVSITGAGDIALGVITAKGDDVTLVSAGKITDNNGAANNVTADILNVTGPNGVEGLETSITQLSSTGSTDIVNAGAMAITKASLEGGSSSFIAESLTILDMAGDTATIANNTSLTLQTTTGNIVFLDTNDTIVAQGSGTVTINAGTTDKSGAVAIIGNITTANQNISITADSHITIGLLNAGIGDVSVSSDYGVVLDGNSTAVNVIARNFSLSGTTPTVRQAELHTTNSIANAHAHDSEVAAKLTLLEANTAAMDIMSTAESTANYSLTLASSAYDTAQAEVDRLAPIENGLKITTYVLDGVSIALSTAASAIEVAAGAAQAIPFSGDAGSEAAAAVTGLAANVAGIAAYAIGIAHSEIAGQLDDAEDLAFNKDAEMYAAKSTLTDAIANHQAYKEATSISQAAYDAAVIERNHNWQVARQAVLAEDASSTAGTLALPFGIQISGQLDVNAVNSDVVLAITGPAVLNSMSATKTAGTGIMSITATDNISVVGALVADDYIRLETTGQIINGNAGHSLTASKFVGVAGTGIGASGGLNTSVTTMAASTTTGDVTVTNNKALTLGTVDGVSGITTAGNIVIAATSPLTVSNNVTTSGGTVALTAGNSANSGDDFTLSANTTISAASTVTLTAGDNVAVESGAQITGTTVTITANNTGDGEADGVNGGATIAGNINASSLVLSGGGVNHSGTITSAGSVNISATSTAASSVNGITLGSVTAGGQIDVVSSNKLVMNQNVTTTSGAVVLTAGDSSASGDDLTLAAGKTISSGDNTITLTSGDNMSIGAAAQITGTTLVLAANHEGAGVADGVSGSMVLAGNLSGQTVTISGAGLTHTGSITSNSTVSVNVNSAATSAISGISLAAVTAGGQIDVTSSHALTLTQNVQSTGGPITITAGLQTTSVDNLTVDAGVTVQSSAGVAFSAGDSMTFGLGSQVTGTGITLIADKAGDGDGDGVSGSINLYGNVNGSSVDVSAAGFRQTGTITSSGDVDIAVVSTLSSPYNGIALGTISAAGHSVKISATGTATAGIADNNGAATNVTAADLAMVANGGVGASADALETQVSNLAATGGSGGVTISNSGDLSLTTVEGVTSFSAADGALSLVTTGNLLISDGFVQGAGLTVTLQATGGNINETNSGAAADVVGNIITLTTTGLGNGVGDVANRLELNAQVLNVTTDKGDVYLHDTAGGVAVGLITTGTTEGTRVDMMVSNGGVTEDPGHGHAPKIIADELYLNVTGHGFGIGHVDNDLNVDLTTFVNVTTEGGSIYMADADYGFYVDLVSTNSASTNIAMGTELRLVSLEGSIEESPTRSDAAVDLKAERVVLLAQGENDNIGTVEDAIEIKAANLFSETESGARSSLVAPDGDSPIVEAPGQSANALLIDGDFVGGDDSNLFQEIQSTGNRVGGDIGGGAGGGFGGAGGAGGGFGGAGGDFGGAGGGLVSDAGGFGGEGAPGGDAGGFGGEGAPGGDAGGFGGEGAPGGDAGGFGGEGAPGGDAGGFGGEGAPGGDAGGFGGEGAPGGDAGGFGGEGAPGGDAGGFGGEGAPGGDAGGFGDEGAPGGDAGGFGGEGAPGGDAGGFGGEGAPGGDAGGFGGEGAPGGDAGGFGGEGAPGGDAGGFGGEGAPGGDAGGFGGEGAPGGGPGGDAGGIGGTDGAGGDRGGPGGTDGAGGDTGSPGSGDGDVNKQGEGG